MKPKHWIFLSLILLVSALLRVIGWEQVFPKGIGNEPILLREVDSYYHLRLIDNMLANFPQSLRIDQFAALGGISVGYPPLLSWGVKILTDIVTFFGFHLGPNVEYLSTFISTLLPVIFGVLSIALIFVLGSLLHSKGAGLIGALLAGVLPSELLHRSLLGYIDHHIFEVFFLLATVICLLLLEKRKKVLWCLPAGLSIGGYLLNWAGGLFIVGIILVWISIKFLVDYFKEGKLETSLYVGTSFSLLTGFLLSLLLVFTFTDWSISTWIPLVASTVPLVLLFLSKVEDKKVVIGILVIVVLGTLGFLGWKKDIGVWLLNSLLAVFWGFGSTIQEALPTDFLVFFASFGIAFIFFFLGIWYYRKAPNILFLVLSGILLFAMIGQRRWIYYGAIPVCLFSGIAIIEMSKQVLPKVQSAVITVCLFFLIIVPIKGTLGIATMRPDLPFQWYETLTWLRNNTPEPFTDTNAYYKLDVKEEAKYTVLSWWDYGHWIIEIGRRVPLTSPTWQVLLNTPECKFFLEPLPESRKYIEPLKVKYIIIDGALVEGKFYAIGERNWPKMGPEETQNYWPTSTLKALWEGEPEGFRLIHQYQDVKVFEVLDQ